MSYNPENPIERPYDSGDSQGYTSSDASTDDADSASRDERMHVLGDRRRRYTLQCLQSSRTPMALADLADELVRWETNAEPTAVQDKRERIYISLYHHHLPKLVERGLVSFDLNKKLVGLREATDGPELGNGKVQRDGFLHDGSGGEE